MFSGNNQKRCNCPFMFVQSFNYEIRLESSTSLPAVTRLTVYRRPQVYVERMLEVSSLLLSLWEAVVSEFDRRPFLKK